MSKIEGLKGVSGDGRPVVDLQTRVLPGSDMMRKQEITLRSGLNPQASQPGLHIPRGHSHSRGGNRHY